MRTCALHMCAATCGSYNAVMDGCDFSPYGCWEMNSGLLEGWREKPAILPTELSLQILIFNQDTGLFLIRKVM